MTKVELCNIIKERCARFNTKFTDSLIDGVYKWTVTTVCTSGLKTKKTYFTYTDVPIRELTIDEYKEQLQINELLSKQLSMDEKLKELEKDF